VEIPSYLDNNIPRGCLIAHLALTLIEMQRISSYFRIPLYNLFTQYSVEDYSKINVDSCWKFLLTSSFLHDIGKLTDQYINRYATGQDRILHHQVSAVIAKKTLENIVSEPMALGIAYGILFHHEAMDWIAVEKSLLYFSYIQRTLSPTRNIIYNLSERRLNKFKENVRNIFDQCFDEHLLTESQHQTLTLMLARAAQKLIDNREISINVTRELSVAKMENPKYLTPALALYRLLYLTDNRAASARELYWLELIQGVDWKRIEDIARQITNKLAKRYRYIGLSSIPIRGR